MPFGWKKKQSIWKQVSHLFSVHSSWRTQRGSPKPQKTPHNAQNLTSTFSQQKMQSMENFWCTCMSTQSDGTRTSGSKCWFYGLSLLSGFAPCLERKLWPWPPLSLPCVAKLVCFFTSDLFSWKISHFDQEVLTSMRLHLSRNYSFTHWNTASHPDRSQIAFLQVRLAWRLAKTWANKITMSRCGQVINCVAVSLTPRTLEATPVVDALRAQTCGMLQDTVGRICLKHFYFFWTFWCTKQSETISSTPELLKKENDLKNTKPTQPKDDASCKFTCTAVTCNPGKNPKEWQRNWRRKRPNCWKIYCRCKLKQKTLGRIWIRFVTKNLTLRLWSFHMEHWHGEIQFRFDRPSGPYAFYYVLNDIHWVQNRRNKKS